jgi:uncharacterized protein YjbI with pentapeptide repeats
MKSSKQLIVSGQDYFQEKFSNLNFIDQDLTKVSFEKCVFDHCIFTAMKLTDSNFVSCQFKNSDLSNINLSNSEIAETSFEDCKLIGIKWKDLARGILPTSLKFTDSILDFSSFNSLEIENLKIINSSAKEVDFREAKLKKADFTNSDLEGSIFHQTDLEASNFKGAENYLIDFRNNKLKDSIHSVNGALNLLNSLKIKVEGFND